MTDHPDPSPTPEAPDLPQGVSVVVPVYNSEESLTPLVEQLAELFRGRGQAFEVLLVNDGSRDRSWAVVSDLATKHPFVRGFDLMRNFGQHNALLCGVRAARYAVVVTMDDDLQHPPAEVPKLLAKLDEGCDVVYGAPRELPHGLLRNLASKITKIALQTAMGAETARRVSAFRAFRTRTREAFAHFSGSFVSLDVLLTWGTVRFAHEFVRHEPRRLGQSNYTTRKLVTHAFNMITGFSTLPLQAASVLGFGLTVFGLALLAYVVVMYFAVHEAPAGFPFLASVISLFSGAQLFSLGMIGEYLGRVHFRLLDKPTYVVRQTEGGKG
ncbi:Putative glycosyltransferase OS=Anaerolinea thermophila (strain DSM 14523 / JCM 11388 / NBRC 100420 / UNI-1) GN=ANT_20140 PE=4 SV=1: Glycos_transf_2 [Gemmataceae bacterium]|nr:Putative glycosyltransferase OS=Anaerolinea thermophila (strain DSM 14523 / JCM 11388 / NBRC 100420 / UNI-1) GN=ANT_20140 PE=4 SV=1: Glycos_transf_2 [Gemmataceae bacterium]VTT99448.1 Putative glycosyltransferase OS=Anaerolinea thermophila (strain DSM 14523 / JCM 11388 / NBRC 100420 / UNI-1) GN=ANT_20140 PE=4 SV=1: Glycos_transf_2 [Gemmataceae bacterium]